MQPTEIYSITFGGVLFIFLGLRLATLISQRRYRRLVTAALKHLIYPHLHKRFLGIDPPPRYQALLQAAYCAGTLACNIVGSTSASVAGLRAGRISTVTFVPLVFATPLGYAADLLGLSTATFVRFHGYLALMMVVQASFHVATIMAERPFSSKDPVHFSGLLVRSSARTEQNQG